MYRLASSGKSLGALDFRLRRVGEVTRATLHIADADFCRPVESLQR